MKLALFITVVLALVLAASATAGRPRPQCPPSVHPCRITWVAYTWEQSGHDQDGNQYVRTCHVPKPGHGRRWCGPWRLRRQ